MNIPVLDIGQYKVPSRKLAVIVFVESEAIHIEMGQKCSIAFGKKDKLVSFGTEPEIKIVVEGHASKFKIFTSITLVLSFPTLSKKQT